VGPADSMGLGWNMNKGLESLNKDIYNYVCINMRHYYSTEYNITFTSPLLSL